MLYSEVIGFSGVQRTTLNKVTGARGLGKFRDGIVEQYSSDNQTGVFRYQADTI